MKELWPLEEIRIKMVKHCSVHDGEFEHFYRV